MGKKIKKLTREQRKIILLSIIILLSFLLCWIFVYQPQSRKFTAIKDKLKDTQAQIAQITSMAKEGDLALAFLGLERDLAKAVSKLARNDQDAVYILSETAKRLGLDIKNITPGSMKVLDNKIPGYEVSGLPIVINLSCELRELGEYLISVRETCPILVRLRQVDIQGRGEGQPGLDVTLQLEAYLSRRNRE